MEGWNEADMVGEAWNGANFEDVSVAIYTKGLFNSVLATVCQLGRLTLLHNRTLTTTMHVHTSFLINHKSLWVYLRADDVILLKSETVSTLTVR